MREHDVDLAESGHHLLSNRMNLFRPIENVRCGLKAINFVGRPNRISLDIYHQTFLGFVTIPRDTVPQIRRELATNIANVVAVTSGLEAGTIRQIRGIVGPDSFDEMIIQMYYCQRHYYNAMTAWWDTPLSNQARAADYDHMLMFSLSDMGPIAAAHAEILLEAGALDAFAIGFREFSQIVTYNTRLLLADGRALGGSCRIHRIDFVENLMYAYFLSLGDWALMSG